MDVNKPFVIRYLRSELYLLLLCLVIIGLFANRIILSLVLVALMILDFLFCFIKWIVFAKGSLDIKTPDGSNQPYHPSVLYFDKKMAGYSYVMAYTPMPLGALPYTDRWECPTVMVSEDGKKWKYPATMEYIDDLSPEEINNKDYFSDPHLLYNDATNQVYLYYRLSSGPQKDLRVFLRITSDCINWSNRQLLIFDNEINKLKPTSPAFMKHGSEFLMVYVSEGVRGEVHSVWIAKSYDGIQYSGNRKVFFNEEIDPWHIDCQLIDNVYYMLVYSFDERITLFSSDNGECFNKICVLLYPSKDMGSFFNNGLYRSCMIKDRENFKIYFSAKNKRRVCIGLMQGKTLLSFDVVSASKPKFKEFIMDYFFEIFKIEHRIIRAVRNTLISHK